MNILKYFFIFFFFVSYFSSAQKELKNQTNIILESNSTDQQKTVKLQNLLVQYKKHSSSLETGVLYNELAKIQFKLNKNELAINSLKKSILVLKKYKKTDLFELNRARNNLAWIYMVEEKVNEQHALLQEIIKDKGKDENTFNAILNSSIIEAKNGDYYLGLNKLNLLLSEKQSLEKEITIRTNIIKIYAIMTESDHSEKIKPHLKIIKIHQKKVENTFTKSNLNTDLLYEFYNNLANIFESFEDYDTALQLYLKSKKYFSEQNKKTELLYVINNIGYLYAKQNKTKQAIENFQYVINSSEDVNQIATAYDNIGYFSNIKSSKKIAYFQKAIQTILEKKETIYTLPTLDVIKNSGYQQEVLVYLVDLAFHSTEAFKETKNKAYLLKAKETLYRIDELVSVIRYESNTEQSKLFWIEKGVNTYMLAVEVCYLLNKPDEGFYFMEKNKALLLQENIKTFQAKLEIDIPKKIREQEYKLHYELLAVEKKYQQNPNNKIARLNFDKKNTEFQKFMTSLSVKYPNYTKIKQKIDIVSLKKVLSTFKSNECFVSYILNQKDGYGLFCNGNEKIFFKINDIATFQNNIKILKNYISKQVLDKKNVAAFQALSYKIFTELFPFNNAIDKLKNKKIHIIPDENLSNFPFEALAIHPKNNLTKSYLINTTEISYLQSFSLYKKISEKKNAAKKKLLAIAPYQFEDKNLTELIKSKDVITNLKELSSCDIMIEEEATKENFYKKSSDYEILYLNTHAGIDKLTESPWIAFRKDKLTINELYGINNQAELVILDACKTNDGTFVSGEGIISLSRAFFMNGSKSVLSSLWNVNEKAGNEIIILFYKELAKGRSKSKALQIAKINYLKTHQYSEILPYHWASFTLTGSTDPIEIKQSWFHRNVYVLILSSIVIILSLFIYFKRK